MTALTCVRAVCHHDRHLLLQSVTITPENYSGTISIESFTEGPQPGTPWSSRVEGEAAVIVRRTDRGTTIAMASHDKLRHENSQEGAGNSPVEGFAEQWTWRAQRSEAARFNRSVVVYSSREVQDPAVAASEHVCRAWRRGWMPTFCNMRKPGRIVGAPAEWR